MKIILRERDHALGHKIEGTLGLDSSGVRWRVSTAFGGVRVVAVGKMRELIEKQAEVLLYAFEENEKVSDWIRENMQHVTQYRSRMNSYRLKHIIEKSIGYYVYNGEVIHEMRKLGYACKFYNRDGILRLNCCFNAIFKQDAAISKRRRGQLRSSLFSEKVHKPNQRLVSALAQEQLGLALP